MKLKKEFLTRTIAGETILVPIGENNTAFNGLITMNEIGLFIWENIEQVADEDEMLTKILSEYDIDQQTASADLKAFLDTLKKSDII